MSFLQTLRNREKLLRWFEDAAFKRRVRAFKAAHAGEFAGAVGSEFRHSWFQLHNEFKAIFEDRLQHFLDTERVRKMDFVALAKRYAKGLEGEDAREWNAFLEQLTVCEDIRSFVELMREAAACDGGSGGSPAAAAPSPGEAAPSASPAEALAAPGPLAGAPAVDEAAAPTAERLAQVLRCAQQPEFRRATEAFVRQHAPSFAVRSKEHRHEWFLLHSEYARLFEVGLSAALAGAGVSEDQLAALLDQQRGGGEELPELRGFLDVLVPAEDYLSFWQMMTAAAASPQQLAEGGEPTDAAEALGGAAAPAADGAHSGLDAGGGSCSSTAQAVVMADISQLERTEAVREAFLSFLEAAQAHEASESYRRVLACVGLGPGLPAFAQVRDALRPELNRKLAGLLESVDQRLAERGARAPHGRYRTQPLAGSSCAVCGAGPVGLRAAAEIRALGADVVVFDKRSDFSRMNRLKLWEWVKFDLLSWGARHVMPRFGAGAGHLHIGIKQLQLFLWKVCLLLGVDLRLSCELREDGKGRLRSRPCGLGAETESGGEAVLCDVLVEAGGPGGLTWPHAGFSFDVVGTAEAIGLVANFQRQPGPGEELKEFSWARQFNQEMFRRLEEEVGANLENIVYLRGEEAHYFVATPRRRGLVAAGVLQPSGVHSGALHPDASALRAHARAIASFFGLPSECDFAAEPQLFDFSRRRSCNSALRLAAAPAGAAVAEAPALVAVVGDALLEPFWPEGLGITRGFLGALDSAWELSGLSAGDLRAVRAGRDTELAPARLEAACRARDRTCKILKQLGAANQTQYLSGDEKAFGLDPRSRYKQHLLA